MPWFDLFILAVLLVSTVLSLARGFTRDAVGLASWVGAFVLALALGDKLALILPESWGEASLRLLIAMVILFVATLAIGMAVDVLLTGLIDIAHLKRLDRSLGAVFGFLRGLVILALIAVGGAFIGLDHAPWWRASRLMPYIELFLDRVQPVLPEPLGEALDP
ncbi:MAG: hypothetical protein KatS3mg121_0153 [Gammaproteobacteria bacterium]|nr:MAG: hypothetical protein KatS3mg121_0153 [Gammaproteobacteria bacterium]